MRYVRVLLLGALILPSVCMAGSPSKLWGRRGELWKSDSRLPFFGYAGYHCGDKPIPDVKAVCSVLDYGAKANDDIGDSDAIQAAIDKMDSGAVLIPAGRFILDKPITIKKSNVVLRGAGPRKTILYVPCSLQELNPLESNADGGTKLAYSFGGAFLSIEGTRPKERGVAVVEPARRGDTRLQLKSTKGIDRGSWIQLNMKMNEELGRHVHAGCCDAGEGTLGFVCSTVAQVKSVDKKSIKLDRPLRLDVRPEWNPTVGNFEPSIEEVGLENFTIEMAGRPKEPHLLEEGFNAIQMTAAVNCWARRIEIIDADMGIKLDNRSRFCQIERVLIRAEKRKLEDGSTGHHAIWLSGVTQGCLVSDFHIETEYVHDITYEGMAHGNVMRRGKGVRLNFDHHRNAPFENLLTDIDVGNPDRLWDSSGSGHRGPHSAARSTAWNIRHNGDTPAAPKKGHFPQLNMIGIKGVVKSNQDEWHVEPLGGNVSPPDLYEAQLKRRGK
ncbi:glycosyl hydrolase family 28-related protein [Pontiellaceae bacterium B12227]|nr:glycosyl hydrolase family 28-related protein [Pontiellaceae bacterium B12227]